MSTYVGISYLEDGKIMPNLIGNICTSVGQGEGRHCQGDMGQQAGRRAFSAGDTGGQWTVKPSSTLGSAA